MGRRDIDEFRDPRFDPIPGDVVEVDIGDGEFEKRKVIGRDRRSGDSMVRFRIGDSTAEHTMRLRHWREYADDSTVLDRGLPA